MKKETFKRCLAWILMVVLIVSGIGTGQITTIQAATRKPSKIVLNEKEVSTSVGCKVKLKVKSVSPKKHPGMLNGQVRIKMLQLSHLREL